MNNVLLVLGLLGLLQALLLCIYLFLLEQGNKKSNILLALVLLGLTVRVGKSLFGHFFALEAWERNIGIAGIFISGPCLWLYGISLIEKSRIFFKGNYLHFLPFLSFCALIPIIPSDGDFATFWNYGLVVLHLIIYLALSWIYLMKHRSNTSPAVFKWYRNILVGVSVVWVYYLGNLLDIMPYYIAGPIFYTFLIYAFSYLFLNRHNFALDKYGSSTLDKDASRDIFEKVRTQFVEQRLYLEPGISLNSVAQKLAINPRTLSQVINENEDQSFNEFVNHYRIENAKALLSDPKNINQKIATIAFDAGFGTVTSLNVAFKKKTGLTPSEYRKLHV